MDVATATQVLAITREAAKLLNDSVIVVMKNCEYEEFHRFRRHVGKCMGELYIEINKPIYEQHPELVPEELSRYSLSAAT
jgi:hypothetical protein